ncbi:hypothetical protein NECAME_06911 [Necator americanus]|uniref:Uncharacterized protein n=1 Tax=Necator americanus TaxID=51031 RepID=W2TRQ9_NECAM|nr:hypothetical protein NECAME_06911 [Necator americanus]ETN84349.1 hypothetical protein NECAME_06911 [Necator americanus]
MELPDVVKEKLIELDDENKQLRAEVCRLRATITNKDAILNELEEENVQLREAKQNETSGCSKCANLELTVTNLNLILDEKNRECCKMEERIEVLTTSLTSSQDEIDELRRARTPLSPEQSTISEPANNDEMMRVQEERDDALFELEKAKYRINALEQERDDLGDRADAANAEIRDMTRHLKELREQLHGMEAELAASRNSVSIANRGNSMFAEVVYELPIVLFVKFAEERVRLEADMKSLFSKYEAVRMQNYQLSNELDEARLLALRRTRNEGTARCRCHELSPELIHLRLRTQTLEDRLAKARNELVDMARVTKGIDPRLKSFYRSLKIEMESLRQERDKYREERDKLVDEKATLMASVRVANAEKSLDYANDDVESLKLQLAMAKERDQKKDATKVAEMMNGGNENELLRLSTILSAAKSTPASRCEPVAHAEVSCRQEDLQSIQIPPSTPLVPTEQHCSFNSTFDISERLPTEVRLKKLRFADTDQNEKEEAQRRESISASELRRIARKQARRAHSKVLPIGEPIFKVAAKIINPSAVSGRQEREKSPQKSLEAVGLSCSTKGKGSQFEGEGSLMDCSTASETYDENKFDQTLASKLSHKEGQQKLEEVRFLSEITGNEDEFEMNFSFKKRSLIDVGDFNKTSLEDVPEEKENDLSCKSSQGS